LHDDSVESLVTRGLSFLPIGVLDNQQLTNDFISGKVLDPDNNLDFFTRQWQSALKIVPVTKGYQSEKNLPNKRDGKDLFCYY
jgi:hypothetical protein